VFNWLVWRSDNGVRHINKVKPRRAQLELQGTGDHLWQLYHPGIYQGHAGQLSLAIPKWSGAMKAMVSATAGQETAGPDTTTGMLA